MTPSKKVRATYTERQRKLSVHDSLRLATVCDAVGTAGIEATADFIIRYFEQNNKTVCDSLEDLRCNSVTIVFVWPIQLDQDDRLRIVRWQRADEGHNR